MSAASPEQESFGSTGSGDKGKPKGKGWYGDKGAFKGKGGEGKGPPGKFGGPPGAAGPGGEYGGKGAGPPGAYGKGEYGAKGDPYGKGGYGKGDGSNPYAKGGPSGPGGPPPGQQSYQQSYQQAPPQQQQPLQQQQEQQQQQKAAEAPPKLVGAAWPPAAIFLIEGLKVADWMTEMLKILCNAPAAKPYWGWVCMTFVLATVVIVMRAIDQIALLVRAARWEFGKKCCLGCLVAPFIPLNLASWSMYDQRNLPVEHLKVFRQRPLGTAFLGIPGYNVMSAVLLDRSLVMHPAQAHFRSAQSIWQTFLEDVPCFIVDMVVIMNAHKDEDTFWFKVSFGYSVFLTLILIAYAVREVDFTERNLEIMADNKTNLPALTNGP